MQPTFMTVWIGSNDVLPAVLAATPIDGVTMTPVDFFAGLYGNAVGALATTTAADIVLINVPYPTESRLPPALDTSVRGYSRAGSVVSDGRHRAVDRRRPL